MNELATVSAEMPCKEVPSGHLVYRFKHHG